MHHFSQRARPCRYRYRIYTEDGRHVETTEAYLHRRDYAGKSGGRKSMAPSNNMEMIRRAVSMNLVSGSGTSGVTSQNSGLAAGEVWVRITVVNGANHSPTGLQRIIIAAVGTQLRFYNTCVEGKNFLTYAKVRQKEVHNYRKSLQNARDALQGSQLITDITIVPEPRVPSISDKMSRSESINSTPLPETWIEALKQCFVQRYQPNTRTLDLSSLHTDPDLLSQGLYLPLNKQAVVHALIAILKQNQAQLSVLNLSSNRLTHLNAFSPLSSTSAGCTPVSIERIDLSSNPLSGIPILSGLRDIVGLVELDLTETPLLSKFHPNDRVFAAKLQKILPTIKRLNGQDLPQTVQFAIEQGSDSTKPQPKPLPQSIQGYFPNDEVKTALLSFLKLYLNRYDTQPRGENLLPYYTSLSQLAFSVVPESRIPSTQNVSFNARIEVENESGQPTVAYLTTSRLTQPYFTRSRNLLRCRDESRRRDMVVRGSLAIASFLDELPATEHQLESLSVDVAFHSENQMLFTFGGVFYEVAPIASSAMTSTPEKSVRKILRCFTRTMILAAPGGHVIQDDFIISNPSTSLCKKYITEMATKSRKVNPTPTQQPASNVNLSIPDAREPILTEFSRRTGMNIPFSKQCLEEFAWDVNAAFKAFETMNSSGKIPIEAFIP
ncbi:unnamed protein product [Trichobilharzia szidati]|nr:unnamed protein product [Trichobilharzia szidati]